MQELTPAGAMESDRNCARAPCGDRMRVPVGAQQGDWLHCPHCGKTHQLARANGSGKTPKLE